MPSERITSAIPVYYLVYLRDTDGNILGLSDLAWHSRSLAHIQARPKDLRHYSWLDARRLVKKVGRLPQRWWETQLSPTLCLILKSSLTVQRVVTTMKPLTKAEMKDLIK